MNIYIPGHSILSEMGSGTRNDDIGYDDILDHPYWLHRIPLGDDRYTPGFKSSNWKSLGLPENLAGKSFLEIGAADGLYAFEAERRGADDVLATDIWNDAPYAESWWETMHSEVRGFELVSNYMDSNVRDKIIPVEDVSPETVGTFDIVLFSDTIYNVKNPYGAIENVVAVAEEMVVVKSPLNRISTSEPVMKFTHQDGKWNWWLPNLESLDHMMRSAGCVRTESFYHQGRFDDAGVPDVKQAEITGDSQSIYRDHHLNEQIGDVQMNSEILVLYRKEDVSRIHVIGDGAQQGWIRNEDIQNIRSRADSSESIFEQAISILMQEGMRETIQKSVNFLVSKVKQSADAPSSHGVVKGYI